jgi:hypothetical protein
MVRALTALARRVAAPVARLPVAPMVQHEGEPMGAVPVRARAGVLMARQMSRRARPVARSTAEWR